MKQLKGRTILVECDECGAKQKLAFGSVALELDAAQTHSILEGANWTTGADEPDKCPKCAGNKPFTWGKNS